MIAHEVVDFIPYPQNSVRRVREGARNDAPTDRRPDARTTTFTVLHGLKARGATDYLALPIASQFGFGTHMAAVRLRSPGGFTRGRGRRPRLVSPRLSVIADMNSQRQIAENVLKAYLGPQHRPEGSDGADPARQRRGISAVLWSSDLRGFTELSDHLPGERVIALLNDLFDLQARAIAGHGGEILKFVGDGLLAIFPVADPSGRAARRCRARSRRRKRRRPSLASCETACRRAVTELEMVVALHYGAAIYGNSCAVDRLDFTVIGPAVNLVSRIEAVAKSRDLPLVVSDDFANAYGRDLTSLGLHSLRGLDRPHELFTAEI